MVVTRAYWPATQSERLFISPFVCIRLEMQLFFLFFFGPGHDIAVSQQRD